MGRKMSWSDIKAQICWLYDIAFGIKRSIILLTGLSTAYSLLSVFSALLIKSLIDIAVGNQQSSLSDATFLFMLTLLAEIVLNTTKSILSTKAKIKQANLLQARLFRKLMVAKWQVFIERHSGDYCNRMISDVEAINNFLLSSVPDIIATSIQVFVATWVLLHFEPGLSIMVLTITPVFVILMRLFAQPLREATLKMQSLKGESLSLSQESILNVITIRAFESQDETCRKLSGLQSILLHWAIRRTKLNALSSAIQSVSWSATYILSLLWGITRLTQKAISYGSMTAYLQLVFQIQVPLRRLISQIPQMIATSASVGRLIEVLDMPEEELSQGDSSLSGTFGVTLQDICFSYQDGEKVLDMLNMVLTPGVMTALVGSTGAGKSTIVRLLLGLVEPQSGSIVINRHDGDSRPIGACTRRAFTYVQQGNTAISGSIADNLRMAKPTATIEEMETVLKLACAWDYVFELPHKMESRIGEHGIGLSEGQLQRLAIARALLRDAPILILDEATSALDKKTEAQVLMNIQSALQGRTCLIITHRSAALRLCSRVYRLSNGKAFISTTNFRFNKAHYRIKKNRTFFAAPAS